MVQTQVIVELKGLARLTMWDEAQLVNYLKSSQRRVRLVIHFGAGEGLEWKRLVR